MIGENLAITDASNNLWMCVGVRGFALLPVEWTLSNIEQCFLNFLLYNPVQHRNHWELRCVCVCVCVCVCAGVCGCVRVYVYVCRRV